MDAWMTMPGSHKTAITRREALRLAAFGLSGGVAGFLVRKYGAPNGRMYAYDIRGLRISYDHVALVSGVSGVPGCYIVFRANRDVMAGENVMGRISI